MREECIASHVPMARGIDMWQPVPLQLWTGPKTLMGKSGLSRFCSHVAWKGKVLDSGTKLGRVVKNLEDHHIAGELHASGQNQDLSLNSWGRWLRTHSLWWEISSTWEVNQSWYLGDTSRSWNKVLHWRSQYADWTAVESMDNCPYSRNSVGREGEGCYLKGSETGTV